VQTKILDKLKLSGKLPTPKGIALEVITLTQRENVSNHDIVHIISADPALCVRVIKAANVLVASTTRPVVTISDAVSVLGMRALRQLVIGMSLIENHQHGACKQFNYAHYWAHSLLTGIAVRYLTERSKLASPEDIFTLGLLGGVGRLALATIYPDAYGAIVARDKDETLEKLYNDEYEQFGFDQAELSAAILADMNFPVLFERLIHDYPKPESSSVDEGSREWKLMNMLHLASLLADVCLAEKAQQHKLIGELRAAAGMLAIEEAFVIEVADKCARDWPEWTKLLNLGSRQLPAFAELLKQADNTSEAIINCQFPHLEADYKMRVLVVDDDRAMRLIMEKMLQAEGHIVTSAENGIEALSLLEKERPQLIVTDWVMPQMDGITLCRKLRENPQNRSIYVIVVTAHESPGKLVEAFEAGADDYVLKPITPKMFHARLRAAQRVVQLQEELAADREKLLRFSTELSAVNEQLLQHALTDSLTGLPNRRLATERMEQEWALTERGERALSCLMVDIDHFKLINDKYGHQVGDDALKLVANTLRQAARAQDVVCRYGGEEFLVICPDTQMDAAIQCAERLRLDVAAQRLKLPDGNQLHMTVSVGVAEKNGTIKSLKELQIRADKNLYLAKAAGRNCTRADR